MRFNESIEHALRNYARFRGRATRSQFWWFVLLVALLDVAGLTIIDVIEAIVTRPGEGTTMIVVLLGCSLGIVDLLLLLPLLAVSVRRFHDVGLSGWWYGLSILVYLLAAFQDPRAPASYLRYAVPACLASTLLVACLRGTRGANRHGYAPGDAIGAVFDADPPSRPAE